MLMMSNPGRSNVAWIPILLWCLGAVAAGADDQEVGDDGRVVEAFSIAKGGDMIFLPVELAGRKYPFMLDTAASHNVFDESLKPHLGRHLKTPMMQTGGRDVPIDLFEAPSAHVGKLRLPLDHPVGCIDFGRLRQVVGRDFYGVLGAPFLDGLIIQIDFDRGELRILEGRPLDDAEQWGESVKGVRDRRSFLWITASVGEDTRRPFLIDTAFNATGSLSQAVRDELVTASQFSRIGLSRAAVMGGEIRVLEGRLATFSLGPFQHQNLVFLSGRYNTLGLGYLCRYRVTFDFPADRIYLEKGALFSRPDNADMSGLHLVRRSGRIEADWIDDGSPADMAGMRPKDVIAEFQGTRASELDLFTIRRQLGSGEGELIRLTVNRGGQEIHVAFRLREKNWN